MDEAAWKKKLGDGAAELGVPLDESQVDRLWRLGNLLRERNEQVNLTSIVSPASATEIVAPCTEVTSPMSASCCASSD